MATFPGAAELVTVLDELVVRPPFLNHLRRRRPHGEQPLPLVCLVGGNSESHYAGGLARRFHRAERRRVPHALVDAAGPFRLGTQGHQVPPRLPLLHALHCGLAVDTFGLRHRIRFDHYLLANWLTRIDLDAEPGDDPRAKLIRLLRDRHAGAAPDANTLPNPVEIVPDWRAKLALLLFGLLWPASRFWLWASGRVPGLGRQPRWFMRQPFMIPRLSGDFLGFAERLTAGRVDNEDPDQVDRLLVHAFLEDLRLAYRRRPWRLHTWRRTAYTVALVADVADDNDGWALLDLINDVRNETGQLDPLLVVATGATEPPRWSADGRATPQVARAAHAVDRWRAGLPEQRRGLVSTAWYLPLAVPSGSEQPAPAVADERAWDATVTPRPPPALARAATAGLAAAVVAAATLIPTGAVAYPYWTTRCLPVDVEGISVATVRISGAPECVGYSDRKQVFGARDEDGERDERLEAAQRAVFRQNEQAKKLQRARPGRPLISLVYFAGLTHDDEDSDSDRAQAEELEGLLLRQRQQNVKGKSEPLLRVIVANGGARMKAAPRVVRDMLGPLFRTDPTVLGVVGLDRSVDETEQAITALGDLGVPTVATTLSANGLAGRSPLYFQLVPSNTTEARLVEAYARRVGAERVTIYHPRVRGDAYVATLVESLVEELGELAGPPVDWRDGGLSLLSLCADGIDRSDEIVFYAGRHDDFGQFLRDVVTSCDDPDERPRIVADDAVSRFVADERQRDHDAFAGVTVHYVSKGSLVVLAGERCLQGDPPDALGGGSTLDTFCAGYHRLYRDLSGSLQDKPALLWPGERVGAAYDAAGLFLAAVRQNRTRRDEPARDFVPARAAVVQEFRELEFAGVTGRVNFARSRVADDNNLAILRISDIRDVGSDPTCEHVIGDLYETDQRRDPRTGCPTG